MEIWSGISGASASLIALRLMELVSKSSRPYSDAEVPGVIFPESGGVIVISGILMLEETEEEETGEWVGVF